jgi:uracil-DNA glycosylase
MQFSLFDSPPKRYESFDALVEEMTQMDDDVLYPAGTNMVIYRGNPEAGLMIVGEAPGTEEDRLGKPFVGRSGQLLDQMLRAVDLDPEKDVFITNAVFRMPPGDAGGRPLRKPTPEEVAHYRPYLLEIIRLVDPLVIVLSGGVAVQSLLGEKQGITKVRGTWYHWHDKPVMPIFHPAYLLRNPSKSAGSPKALTWQDIREVRQKYDELVSG